MELQAMAQVFECNFEIYSPAGPPITIDRGFPGRVLTLFYTRGLHYDALYTAEQFEAFRAEPGFQSGVAELLRAHRQTKLEVDVAAGASVDQNSASLHGLVSELQLIGCLCGDVT